ncbi:acyl-CoA carboxylase subunit epsilon [Amycolatopsis sp. NPDC088138]|uniref:acyl-CoA carboxylase subunit epsilon n=1 Tax=Amycolatopsis sp. NPDC088138 TaxID=3363938 RepID=UPI0038202EAF
MSDLFLTVSSGFPDDEELAAVLAVFGALGSVKRPKRDLPPAPAPWRRAAGYTPPGSWTSRTR